MRLFARVLSARVRRAVTLLLETEVVCPHCGESFPLMLDTSQGSFFTTEDCTVCCRPIGLEVVCEPGEIFRVAESAQ